MTTTEHLDAIVARCTELLAIAEKRTPGEWIPFPASPGSIGCPVGTRVLKYAHHPIADTFFKATQTSPSYEECRANAAFIASCAGSAEAGWRATIAAIAFLKRPSHSFGYSRSELETVQSIIAAWPPETLNQ